MDIGSVIMLLSAMKESSKPVLTLRYKLNLPVVTLLTFYNTAYNKMSIFFRVKNK